MVAVFPNVCLWRRSYSQNWEVLTLKNCHSIEPPSVPVWPTLLHRMALVSFLLFRKNLGNLREFFGKKLPIRLWYKTRTRYKTRTTDFVYKSSFRKVKLREKENGLAWNSSQASCLRLLHAQTFLYKEKRLCRYSMQLKLNSEFYITEKKELEENSIYSFKPIRSTENKNLVSVLVRVKFF